MDQIVSPWHLRQAVSFERCIDTNAIIWPFQEVYHRSVIWSSMFAADDEWLTEEAYTFRVLTRDSK